jgi:hypothetical protein
MTKQSVIEYIYGPIGCYLDHAYYNATELSVAIIELAEGLGFTVDAELREAMDSEEPDPETLDYGAQEAEDWLNEQETRSFLYWGNDGDAGAFGLWPAVDSAREDCEFVSSRKQEYPEDDYRGEWLHVNDHGNATLYARGDDGEDEEVWSIV